MARYTVEQASLLLSELVRTARQRGEVVELAAGGEVAAVMMSAELFSYYQRLEQEHDLAEIERITAAARPCIPHAEVAARFGLSPDGLLQQTSIAHSQCEKP